MMRVLLIAILMLVAVGRAAAHFGHGGDTQVRVFADKMRVVIRTSIPLAWSRLGAEAPAKADDAGREAALPLLIAAAPSMVQVTAGGKPMTPVSADCMFEVGDHVAFVLNFERPTEWPVEIDAHYVKTPGELDAGTITVYDHTSSRFVRDLEPVAHKNIDGRNSRFSFALKDPAPTVETPVPDPTPAAPVPEAEPDRGLPIGIALLPLLAAAAIGFLLWRRSRRRASVSMKSNP